MKTCPSFVNRRQYNNECCEKTLAHMYRTLIIKCYLSFIDRPTSNRDAKPTSSYLRSITLVCVFFPLLSLSIFLSFIVFFTFLARKHRNQRESESSYLHSIFLQCKQFFCQPKQNMQWYIASFVILSHIYLC